MILPAPHRKMPLLMLSLAAALALISGCSSSSQQHNGGIIIDRKGVDMVAYQADLEQCKAYAEEVSTGDKVAKSSASGAVIGGVLGAVVGNSRTAQKGAGAGAVTGGVKGYSQAEGEKHRVVRNCLKGRGYRVLN
jgi:outer membrane lipoprotein SlyB